ncbi:alpha-L-rhamnosidase [Pedobacter psychroterrae]|nr:alpha-L-rhamnosidase [Pedobacter psychroterrae]
MMPVKYILLLSFATQFTNTNAQKTAAPLSAVNLRTEYKVNPVIEELKPRLSWELVSSLKNQVQTAYQIQVATSKALLSTGKADVWNSQQVKSNHTNQINYTGKPLLAGKRYYWRVRSWDKAGKVGTWSNVSSWEMGLLSKSAWRAEWIGSNLNAFGKGKDYHLPPSPYFRKEIGISKKVIKARLYITALGLYEFYVNGKRAGKDYFTPGWTDYNKRVYYQVYDITNELKAGKNVFGSVISSGWYSGYLGYALLVGNPVVDKFYGDVPLLKAQVEITYADGKVELVGTDASWKTAKGALIESDILNGETYNAQLELKDWLKPGLNTSNWQNATIYPDKAERKIEVYPGNPVQVLKELKAKSVTPRPGGKYNVDLGQNFAGLVRLQVKGKAGDTIRLKYGEMLHPDGRIMTENLRRARATDTYILKGDPNGETWMPQFTYHGFQYVEVEGFRYQPALDAITGIVMTSVMPVAGSFETDNKMVNQLYHNIVWTQQSNYFEVPTDCPQRDERLGWTGDAQVYIQSASFNNDISAFYTKWLVDLNDAQRKDNAYPIYAPAPNIRVTDTYSPGWSEAGIICPYTIFKTYGDITVIKKFWPNMVAYLDFLESKSEGKYYYTEDTFKDISTNGGFGDWLSVGKQTPSYFLATMYYANCASMMAEMAHAIKVTEDVKKYKEVFSKIKQAIAANYINEQGIFQKKGSSVVTSGEDRLFDGDTQTAYANAIYMDLLSPTLKAKAGQRLATLIKENGGKLSTGFLGVKPLLPALSETGNSDVAYQLLLSTEYPSWGFEVINGANTIWERWDSYIKDKGFTNNAGMNSFNHYAFGAVNEWMFGNMAGIKLDETGYRTFSIRPEIAPDRINYVKAAYHSINGKVVSSWKKNGKQLTMEVTIPVNTKADIYIPSNAEGETMEGGKSIKNNPDLKIKNRVGGYQVISVGSGTYAFSTTL